MSAIHKHTENECNVWSQIGLVWWYGRGKMNGTSLCQNENKKACCLHERRYCWRSCLPTTPMLPFLGSVCSRPMAKSVAPFTISSRKSSATFSKIWTKMHDDGWDDWIIKICITKLWNSSFQKQNTKVCTISACNDIIDSQRVTFCAWSESPCLLLIECACFSIYSWLSGTTVPYRAPCNTVLQGTTRD